jgi:ketosteroid isomerase-like protein
MHRRACLNLIGSAVATFASVEAVQAVRAAGVPPEDEIRRVERARFDAMVARDIARLDTLLAIELSYTHGDGRVVDKATFIADLQSGDFTYLDIQPTGMTVRVFGDAAIVTGAAGMRVVNKGSPAQIRIVYTTTHIRRHDSWQMVAWHATRIAP